MDVVVADDDGLAMFAETEYGLLIDAIHFAQSPAKQEIGGNALTLLLQVKIGQCLLPALRGELSEGSFDVDSVEMVVYEDSNGDRLVTIVTIITIVTIKA